MDHNLPIHLCIVVTLWGILSVLFIPFQTAIRWILLLSAGQKIYRVLVESHPKSHKNARIPRKNNKIQTLSCLLWASSVRALIIVICREAKNFHSTRSLRFHDSKYCINGIFCPALQARLCGAIPTFHLMPSTPAVLPIQVSRRVRWRMPYRSFNSTVRW
jgi:hypothetical protein